MLYGKNVLLGVSGGIACYKACEIVSRLKKLGANVDVIMTEHALEFVTPLTFETLSKTPAITDMFAPKKNFDVKHISLAKKADIFVVAPASANVIAKFAKGIADDMLSTTFLACKSQKLICPAMNTQMYDNQATQENLTTLKERNITIFEPTEGFLACGDIGKGRLAEPIDIVNEIVKALTPKQDFDGKTVLITAGGTEENIDGVRVITNHSSGKMGIALAEKVAERGGKVKLVYGNIKVDVPDSVAKSINVKSTMDMLEAVKLEAVDSDIIIMAAAPSDYRLKKQFDNKVKGQNLTLELEKNPDIAKTIGENKDNKKLVIFSAETQNLLENANGKLKRKNADLVVANDVTKQGAGFNIDTNIATLIDRNGEMIECPIMQKSELANIILDKVVKL